MWGLWVQTLLRRRDVATHCLRHGALLRTQPRSDLCVLEAQTSKLWSLCFPAPPHIEHKLYPQRSVLLSVRCKSTKGSKKGNSKERVEEEQDEDPDDDDDQDDPAVPKDYKDVEKFVQSLRFDLIMKAGLDVPRNKIDDAFYGNQLRLNGQPLIKKSKTVSVGDKLDFVLEENKEAGTVGIMRVVFRKVLGETESSEKYKVQLRRWKRLTLPRVEGHKR